MKALWKIHLTNIKALFQGHKEHKTHSVFQKINADGKKFKSHSSMLELKSCSLEHSEKSKQIQRSCKRIKLANRNYYCKYCGICVNSLLPKRMEIMNKGKYFLSFLCWKNNRWEVQTLHKAITHFPIPCMQGSRFTSREQELPQLPKSRAVLQVSCIKCIWQTILCHCYWYLC